jgi:hypothetical protein
MQNIGLLKSKFVALRVEFLTEKAVRLSTDCSAVQRAAAHVSGNVTIRTGRCEVSDAKCKV